MRGNTEPQPYKNTLDRPEATAPMGSSAGPYQMDREPGAPFGVFNLAKFRAEVRTRVDVARAAQGADVGSSSYMNTSAYDSPPPRTAVTSHSRGSQSVDRVHLGSRLVSRDGDEAYEKMHRRAESTVCVCVCVWSSM